MSTATMGPVWTPESGIPAPPDYDAGPTRSMSSAPTTWTPESGIPAPPDYGPTEKVSPPDVLRARPNDWLRERAREDRNRYQPDPTKQVTQSIDSLRKTTTQRYREAFGKNPTDQELQEYLKWRDTYSRADTVSALKMTPTTLQETIRGITDLDDRNRFLRALEEVGPEVKENDRKAEAKAMRNEIEGSAFPRTKAVALQIGASAGSMAQRAVSGVAGAVSPQAGEFYDQGADEWNRTADIVSSEAEKRAEEKWQAGETWVPPALDRVIRGVGVTLPGTIVSGILGGTPGAIAYASAEEGNQALSEGRDAGLSGEALKRYAVAQATIEAVPEIVLNRFGMGALARVFGKSGTAKSVKEIVSQGLGQGLKQAGITTLQQTPPEVITEFGHLFARKIAGVDPTELSAKQLYQTAFDTILQTFATVGALESPRVVASAIATRDGTPSRAEAKKLGIPPEEAKSAPSRREWFEANKGRLMEKPRETPKPEQQVAEPEPPIPETPAPSTEPAGPAEPIVNQEPSPLAGPPKPIEPPSQPPKSTGVKPRPAVPTPTVATATPTTPPKSTGVKPVDETPPRRQSHSEIGKEVKAEERKQGVVDATKGRLTPEAIKYAPLHTLPEPVKQAMQQWAEGRLQTETNDARRSALQKIIEDAGADKGAKVEEMKELLAKQAKGYVPPLRRDKGIGQQLSGGYHEPEDLRDPIGQALAQDPEARNLTIDRSIASVESGEPDALAGRIEDVLGRSQGVPFSTPSEVIEWLDSLRDKDFRLANDAPPLQKASTTTEVTEPTKQGNLFSKAGLPGQGNLFPDVGVPDSMVAKPQEPPLQPVATETAALPPEYWEYQPYAQKVADNVMASKYIDPAIRADVADAAFKTALETYDPAKAGKKTLKRWIKDGVTQAVRNEARKKRDTPAGDAVENVQSPEPSPEDTAMGAEESGRLAAAMAKLSKADRALLAARETETLEQIAKREGVTKEAIRRRESAVKEKLLRAMVTKPKSKGRKVAGAVQEAKAEVDDLALRSGGARGSSIRPNMDVEMEGTGETIGAWNVAKAIEKNTGIPVRYGRILGSKVRGIYKRIWGNARVKSSESASIDVITHEVAHGIDYRTDARTSASKAAKDEVRKLDYEPDKARDKEGFAEFIRGYLTGDIDVQADAPLFYRHFMEWMDTNKEWGKKVTTSKSLIDRLRLAGAVGRVVGQINMGESNIRKAMRSLKKPRTIAEWVSYQWLDRHDPFLNASKEMLKVGSTLDVVNKMDADLNFWLFAKNTNMGAASKARAWAKHGVSDVAGNKIGPGLQEVLAPIAKELRNKKTLEHFYAYCFARHALDVIAAGKTPGITKADAKATVKKFGSRPGWSEAASGVTGWHNALIDYLVDAGGMSKRAADTMKHVYPNYIALARHMDSEFAGQPASGGSRYANLPTAVKRLHGSGRQILPPLESAFVYAERIIGIADKIRVGKMLVDAVQKHKAFGMVEKVPPKTVPHLTTIKRMQKQLEDLGADLTDVDMDSLLTVFSQEYTADAKSNILTLWVDGKVECYAMRDDLYRAMTAYGKPYRLPKVLDVTAGAVARAVRLGATGVRAGFTLTNIMRDLQTALMQTEYQPRNPASIVTNTIRGFVSEITGDEVAQLWKRGGGEMAQPLAIDRRYSKDAVGDILSQSPKDKALNWSRHPVDSLRNLFSVVESAPRLAEFRAALSRLGWKPDQPVTFEQYMKAQWAAANVTVDFREGGDLAMWVNQIVPFFNATIQGPRRMASAFHNHPYAVMTTALMWITLPTILLWWKQKDEEWYKQLTPMERYRYWHLKIPGMDTILRIPKPFEWGHIFGTMVEGSLESAYRENPQAFGEAFETTITDMAPNVLPAIAQAPIEIAANKDFYFDRPLVSYRMDRLKPEDQYTSHTTETAKAIGKLFGVSPINVEHLASGWTGGLATDVVGSVESMAGTSHKTQREIAGGASATPVVGRLFLSPTHTRVFNDFYSKMKTMEREYESRRLQKRGISPPPALRSYRKASELMSDLRSKSRKILDDTKLTDDQKRDQFMALHQRMLEIAKRVMRKN